MALSIPLDTAGVHVVVAREADDAIAFELSHGAGDRLSIADRALGERLTVEAGLGPIAFTGGIARAPANGGALDLVLRLDDGAPLRVARLGRAPLSLLEMGYRLSPFELRYAADNGRLHPIPPAARDTSAIALPTTDLHTHFAACVGAHDLVAIGAMSGVVYPAALLAEAGIRVDRARDVAIAELGPELRAKLASRLEVPLDRRISFRDMEDIYRRRAPITKSPRTFVALLERLAHDYAAMGVRRVELSLSNVVEARVLRAIHREAPRIEAETGVALRFLAAIGRHDDPEWDLDLVERIQMLAGSVYLCGVDFMGHETNSSRAFAPTIRAIAEWADRHRPGFVVRVHAGESPSHPENVRVAALAMRGLDVEKRIGHGLYGVDDATLELLVREDVVVEFNLDSNVALNHLLHARDVPLRRYVERGCRVVLGTDGYGIYRSSAESSARAALLSGLEPRHLAGPLAGVERAYLARASEREAALDRAFDVPDDVAPVHFTPAVAERRRARIVDRDAALAERLAALGAAAVAPHEVAQLRRGRSLVCFAGAWTRSWDALGDDVQARIRDVLEALVEGLEPSAFVLVTGGTRHGVEGLVGAAARRRGLDVVAAIVRETPPLALDQGRFTHVCVVGETLYDKAAGLYELVAANDGACVFAAGGQIVSDEIQTAANLRLRSLLFADVGGASGRHAEEQPARAFRTASEALDVLRALRTASHAHAPHWFRGANPTADAVVLRGGREVLLVLRDKDAPAEPGKWALPGGYVATNAERGSTWRADRETEAEACVRELREETGLKVEPGSLVRIGIYEGGDRDPRDGAVSWSRSTAFLIAIGEEETAIAGGDDAADARWFPIDALPTELAFDHARILADALALAR